MQGCQRKQHQLEVNEKEKVVALWATEISNTTRAKYIELITKNQAICCEPIDKSLLNPEQEESTN